MSHLPLLISTGTANNITIRTILSDIVSISEIPISSDNDQLLFVIGAEWSPRPKGLERLNTRHSFLLREVRGGSGPLVGGVATVWHLPSQTEWWCGKAIRSPAHNPSANQSWLIAGSDQWEASWQGHWATARRRLGIDQEESCEGDWGLGPSGHFLRRNTWHGATEPGAEGRVWQKITRTRHSDPRTLTI